MKITIRIDDITPQMDWPKFLKFKGLLDVYGVKPIIGVIPENMDPMVEGDTTGAPEDYWQYIRNLKDDGYVIAMHGLNHVYTTTKDGLFPLNKFSEFAGHSYERQLDMLTCGRDILRENGVETDIFMAPAHTFDKNTLKALSKLGFTSVTDGFGTEPYLYKDIVFYPISANRGSVLKKKDAEGFTTFVYHINTMNDYDFDSFEKLLKEYDVVSYGDYLKEAPSLRGFWGHLKESMMAECKRMLVRLR